MGKKECKNVAWDDQWHWLKVRGSSPIQVVPIFRKASIFPCLRSGAIFHHNGDLAVMNSNGEPLHNRLIGSIEMNGDDMVSESIIWD